MFRFSIRDLVLITAIVALSCAWWKDHVALRDSRINLTDAERKAEFLLGVLREDGYVVDAPQGVKGPISLPSSNEIASEREEGHIRPPPESRP